MWKDIIISVLCSPVAGNPLGPNSTVVSFITLDLNVCQLPMIINARIRDKILMQNRCSATYYSTTTTTTYLAIYPPWNIYVFISSAQIIARQLKLIWSLTLVRINRKVAGRLINWYTRPWSGDHSIALGPRSEKLELSLDKSATLSNGRPAREGEKRINNGGPYDTDRTRLKVCSYENIKNCGKDW